MSVAPATAVNPHIDRGNRSRTGFGRLAALVFGLGVASFVVRWATRLVASEGLARPLSPPLLFRAVALFAGLVVLAALDATAIRPLE